MYCFYKFLFSRFSGEIFNWILCDCNCEVCPRGSIVPHTHSCKQELNYTNHTSVLVIWTSDRAEWQCHSYGFALCMSKGSLRHKRKLSYYSKPLPWLTQIWDSILASICVRSLAKLFQISVLVEKLIKIYSDPEKGYCPAAPAEWLVLVGPKSIISYFYYLYFSASHIYY